MTLNNHATESGESAMETTLYVGNLSRIISADDLRTLFARAGTVVTVALIKDHITGDPQGFGYVEMASPADAEKALMFNAYPLGDSVLTVNLFKPPGARSDRAKLYDAIRHE